MANLNCRQVSILLLSLFLILFAPFIPFASNSYLEVHFLDAGLGDSILIKLPHGTSILVDTGSRESGPDVIKYLMEQKTIKIDHLILTHYHDDHTGGVPAIADNFSIGKFYDNGANSAGSSTHEKYLSIVRGNRDRYEVLRAGKSLVFDDVKLDVLNPHVLTSDPNNDSIVIRLTYNKFSLLLAGDIGFAGERRILELDQPLKSRVLKVAHHGENDSTSAEFLQGVDPEAAIITVSRINKYARPHQQVLKRLKESGAKIYRTDLHGNVTLITDGNSFSVRTQK